MRTYILGVLVMLPIAVLIGWGIASVQVELSGQNNTFGLLILAFGPYIVVGIAAYLILRSIFHHSTEK